MLTISKELINVTILFAYCIAWLLPCLHLSSEAIWPGWGCALNGIFAVLFGQIEVLANVFFLIGWVCLARGKRLGLAAACGAIAVVLALETLTLFWLDFPTNEGGTGKLRVSGVEIGFYIWLGCFLSLAILAFFERRKSIGQSNSLKASTVPQLDGNPATPNLETGNASAPANKDEST